MNIFRRTIRYYGDHGFKRFLAKYAHYMMSIKQLIVYERDLVAKKRRVSPGVNIFIRELNACEMMGFLDKQDPSFLNEMRMLRPEIERRIRMNHICVGAFNEQKVCGYSWISIFSIHKQDNRTWKFAPSDICYAFDTFISPAYRRQGISSAINAYCVNKAKESHCLKILTMVDKGNVANRSALEKFGDQRIGMINLVTFMNRFKIIFPLGIGYDVVRLIESLRGEKF